MPQPQLIFVDPRSGSPLGGISVGAAVSLPPVVANSTLYVLDDAGRLHAFR